MPRLGVNIDHVATLRQARGEFYPRLDHAARICLENGCDQITIHLREDRRHIQDQDVFDVKKITDQFNKPLNLEMGCAEDILDIAKEARPSWVCLVPEKREEKTTEGGLNLLDKSQYDKVKKTCDALKSSIDGVKISLFLEANEKINDMAIQMGSSIDAVEVHTGDYAKAYLENNDWNSYLTQFENTYNKLKSKGIHVHAGHGLTFESTGPLVEQALFEEYNIGHWIISQSVFEGLDKVVRQMVSLIKR